jgi:hypothetical protein
MFERFEISQTKYINAYEIENAYRYIILCMKNATEIKWF